MVVTRGEQTVEMTVALMVVSLAETTAILTVDWTAVWKADKMAFHLAVERVWN